MMHYLVYFTTYVCLWTYVNGYSLPRGLASRPILRNRRYRESHPTTLAATPFEAEIMYGWNAINKDIFVKKYLQKQPLLIRNAFPDIQSTVSLNFADFAELAIDDDVETRVFTSHKGKYVEDNGPFTAQFLTRLHGSSNWSMLIQEVDRHIPHVADLWHTGFAFMPNWRRDDIMFSYSRPGGSIGAHVDNYDVFLLQGSGKRKWSIESNFITEKEEKRRRVPRTSTRLLRDFAADQEWELGPGDMLYLPPRIPHKGVTVGNTHGITISVGFRAPNYRSVVTALWEEVCSSSLPDEDAFYKDGADLLTVPLSPGSISNSAICSMNADIQAKFLAKLNDPEYFNAWLGRHLTEPLRYRQRGPSAFFLQSAAAPILSSEVGCAKATKNDNSKGAEEIKDEAKVEEEDEKAECEDATLPYSVRSRHSVALTHKMFIDAKALLHAVLSNECALRRAEGLRAAYIDDTLYVDGEAFHDSKMNKETSILLNKVFCDTNYISPLKLRRFIAPAELNGPMNPVVKFFTKFINIGYFYPVSVTAN